MSKQKLSDKSKNILELIAKGNDYSQILSKYPQHTYLDIFNSAKEALELLASSSDSAYQERLLKIREKHPRAYEPWEEIEDNRLTTLFTANTPVREISEIMGRQEGAIRSRLQKLGLIDEETRE